MAKRKICKNCKYIVADVEDTCPNCGSKGQWNESFQGRVFVLDAAKSVIGQKIGAKVSGEYAIRSRS